MSVILDDTLVRSAIDKLRIAADVAETDPCPESQGVTGGTAVAEDYRSVAKGLEAALSPAPASPPDPERAQRLAEEAARTKPTEPPAWVLALKPRNPPTDGTNGVHRALGAWPGEETDAEIREMLAEIS